MSYQIDHTDKINYGSITIEDQSVNQETSLTFIGKNYPGYAKALGENFLHLLENFASASNPTNPVIGQLWYDTDSTAAPSQPQLKVYDGTKWVAAGCVEKSTSEPTTAVVGDLWVDTSNQQLHLWSGSTWILVGPQFAEGTQSGPVVDSVFDTLNINHTILQFIVGGEIVAIISKDSFTPKATIDGFEYIRQGINISEKDFDLDGTVANKLWGVAQTADALRINEVDVASTQFMRKDEASTTNYAINIRSNSGVTVGTNLNTSLSTTTNGASVIYNSTDGSNIFIRNKQGENVVDVITISASNVGVNKTNPTEALDVSGKIVASDGIIVTATTNSADLSTGSIRTSGGAAIAKTLFVGQGMDITGNVSSNSIIPKTDSAYDLGSTAISFRRIYADAVGNTDSTTQFYGTFTGNFAGSVTGTASRLTSPTVFSITGDVTSTNTISFTGQQPSGLATFVTELSSDFISTKTQVVDSFLTDEMLINRPSVGIRKTTKAAFVSKLATVPIGVIMPFAGSTLPTGYLLCDGSEVKIADYPELFATIGYAYKAVGLLLGVATFGVPDLRGRFPLGADNMESGIQVPLAPSGATEGTTITSPANRVTSVTADTVGLANGNEQITIDVENLPEHTHDMKGASGTQFYAIRNAASAPDADAVAHTTNGPDASDSGVYLPNSGGVDSASTDVPVDVMNPYLTINYIIFTGRID